MCEIYINSLLVAVFIFALSLCIHLVLLSNIKVKIARQPSTTVVRIMNAVTLVTISTEEENF